MGGLDLQRVARAFVLMTLAVAATPLHADYREHPRAGALLQTLRQQYGFTAGELTAVRDALADAKRLPQLIEQEQKAPERTETWTQYAKRIDDARVRRGAALLRDEVALLTRAEREYGVPPAVIAGILGIETRYGRITGSVRVLDALATQGFEHPTRSGFFFSELAAYFALCRDQQRDPREAKGSYAGAMGAAQFMPSNYRRLAVDFDGDGRRDLWSLPDAIGSIAHYLTRYDRRYVWRRGEPLIVRANLARDDLPKGAVVNSRDHLYYAGDLRRHGVNSDVELPDKQRVGLISLPLDDGSQEYWLALPNFYAVMTYNPRIFYAMAVAQLAQRIESSAEVAAAQ